MIQCITFLMVFVQGVVGCTKSSAQMVVPGQIAEEIVMPVDGESSGFLQYKASKSSSCELAQASPTAFGAGKSYASVSELQSVSDGLLNFTLNMYKQLGRQSGNLFFSPYSISTVFAMAYAGARKQTAKEMAAVFGFSLPGSKLHRTYASFQDAIGAMQHVSMNTANALWVSKGYEIENDFLKLVKLHYRATAKELNFADEEEARRHINQWVEVQTNEKIKDLIQRGVLDAFTRLLLTNVIYFKGSWAARFYEDLTQPLPFYLSDRRSVQVPMMHQTARFKYSENEDMQLLELPYQGNDLSMIILLPKKPDGLKGVERKLSPSFIKEALRGSSLQQIEVFLPKFKLEQSFSLVQALRGLGIKAAFDKNQADFSAIHSGKQRLHVSDVLHKAFLEVNEKGTEAAAATAAVMTFSSVVATPKIFRADHPFVFMIRHNPTAGILFVGRLTHPGM